MKAAVLYASRDMRISNVDTPETKSNEILIRVKAASICGTDIHFYTGELKGDTPRILGHDFSGVVEVIGKDVQDFSVGDRVITEMVRYCGDCYYCKTGHYHLCDNGAYMGFDIDGAFAEYIAAPVKNAYKVPDNVSFEEASIMEPVALALHVMDFAQPRIGDVMAVIGQGPVGLIHTQIAKLCGMKVVAIEPELRRARLAKDFGADYVINPETGNVKDVISKATDGLGVDCSVEAVGLQKTVDETMEITKKGGKVIIVGAREGLRGPPIEYEDIAWYGVSDGGTCKYPVALSLVSNGKVNVKKLITHEISLEKLPQTMDLLANGKLAAIKVIVKP
jgi:L-iditol 2-dehydrogenase